MKVLECVLAVSVLGVVAVSTPAQDNRFPTLAPNDRVGRVIAPDRAPGNLDVNSATFSRPLREERNAWSPEVQRKVDDFRKEAAAYMKQQEDMRRRLLGAATDSDRERIRTQIQAMREAWLEQARTKREEFQVRQRELQEKLSNRRELLREAAQEKARDHNRRGER